VGVGWSQTFSCLTGTREQFYLDIDGPWLRDGWLTVDSSGLALRIPSFESTWPYLEQGADNVIAIRLDNRPTLHAGSSAAFIDVWLVKTRQCM